MSLMQEPLTRNVKKDLCRKKIRATWSLLEKIRKVLRFRPWSVICVAVYDCIPHARGAALPPARTRWPGRADLRRSERHPTVSRSGSAPIRAPSDGQQMAFCTHQVASDSQQIRFCADQIAIRQSADRALRRSGRHLTVSRSGSAHIRWPLTVSRSGSAHIRWPSDGQQIPFCTAQARKCSIRDASRSHQRACSDRGDGLRFTGNPPDLLTLSYLQGMDLICWAWSPPPAPSGPCSGSPRDPGLHPQRSRTACPCRTLPARGAETGWSRGKAP
jgi:hypothetical protein